MRAQVPSPAVAMLLVAVFAAVGCGSDPTAPPPPPPKPSWATGRLAYFKMNAVGKELYVLNVATGEETPLDAGGLQGPSWAGGNIVYSKLVPSDLFGLVYQVFWVSPNGGPPTQFYPDSPHQQNPVGSRQGRVAYHQKAHWFFGTVIDSAQPAVRETREETTVGWTPDGNAVAVGLCLHDARTIPATFMKCLANNQPAEHPIYSPDGSQIAFVRASYQHHGGPIWVIGSDGSNLRAVTAGTDDYSPAWSPDGSRIAFARGTGLDSEIFVVRPDGTELESLVAGPAGYPAWSP